MTAGKFHAAAREKENSCLRNGYNANK